MAMYRDVKFLWLLAIGILVGLLEFLSLANLRLPEVVAVPFFLLIIVGIGHQTLREGVEALVSVNFKSINLLMLIAVLGAFYLGRYEEAAIIIVLYTLAEKLEEMGIDKSKSVLSSLLEQMPKVVAVKDKGEGIPVGEVVVGDIVMVRPGEMIALDGKVVGGASYVDESTITGEPIPVDKGIGDAIYAGTMNQQGYLEIEVTKIAQETTVAKIQELTFQATHAKAETQKFIESFASYYTPAILILALLWTLVPVWFFGYPFAEQLLGGLTLIVIGCPCALVISTPISIYSAIGNASGRGAVIKGGRFLEAIGRVKAMALDKTRTLTYGKPIVSDIIPFGNQSREHLLCCAAGIEALSEHPLARGIEEAAKRENLTLHRVENFESVVGKGAKADCLVCGDAHHCIGKLAFILEEHHVPEEVIEKVEELQREGKTSIVVATHREVEGIIALKDEVRAESKPLIDGLHKLKIHPVMLTGDHIAPARVVADSLGIKEVRAGLLPEDKAEAIKELIGRYGTVAMVGDGVNDAPALALSHVGITIGSMGSDMAMEAASIVILNDKLDILPFLVTLGKRAITTIQWNTALAIAVKVVFIALALAEMSNLALAIFADVGVTLLVILISLRLMYWGEH